MQMSKNRLTQVQLGDRTANSGPSFMATAELT
jgi:hypothetical protein